jgi:hypothetical protein
MKMLIKILTSIGIAILILIGLIFGLILYFTIKDISFNNIKVPEGKIYPKTTQFLSTVQLDSLKKLQIQSDKVVVVGTGYDGYDFYMWHKPTEEGEIYIKAFEITKGKRLSRKKLDARTKNTINKLSEEYILYTGNSVIDEGTFEKYYPVRFELWFKSLKDGSEKKLAESEYMIDGWDR